MRPIKNVLDLKEKKVVRISLLALSTLSIIVGSAVAYSRVVYEQAINLGSTASGSGSTVLQGSPPVLAVVLVFTGVVISTSLFILLRKVVMGVNEPHDQEESSSASPLFLSTLRTEMQELTTQEVSPNDAMKMIRDLLHPDREQYTESA
jgi:hypothetical protein